MTFRRIRWIACLSSLLSLPALRADDDLQHGLDALNRGSVNEAQTYLERAREAMHDRPAEDASRFKLDMALCASYQLAGRLREAETIARPYSLRWEQTKAPALSQAAQTLGALLTEQGNWPEARRLLNRVLEVNRETFGESHFQTRMALGLLARLDLEQGKFADAKLKLAEALRLARQNEPADPGELSAMLNNLGKAQLLLRDYTAAINTFQEGYRLASTMPANHVLSAEATFDLATAYWYVGHGERAAPLLKDAIKRYEAALGPTSPRIAGPLMILANMAMHDHKFGEAEKETRTSRDMLTAAYGTESIEAALCDARLADVLIAERKYLEADSLLRHALLIETQMYRTAHVNLAHLYHSLGELSEAENNPKDAARFYRFSIDNFEAVQFQGAPFAKTLEEYSRLIQASDKKEAKALRTRARKMTSAFSELKPQIAALGY